MTGRLRVKHQKSSGDRFRTPTILTDFLLQNIKTRLVNPVLEPCAGHGDIARVISKHVPVYAYDIDPGDEGIEQRDMFTIDPEQIKKDKMDIITNPPYGLLNHFLDHFIDGFYETMALLLSMDHTITIARYEIFKHLILQIDFNRQFDLTRWGGGNRIHCGGKIYSWFVFSHEKKEKPDRRNITENIHPYMGRVTYDEKQCVMGLDGS